MRGCWDWASAGSEDIVHRLSSLCACALFNKLHLAQMNLILMKKITHAQLVAKFAGKLAGTGQ